MLFQVSSLLLCLRALSSAVPVSAAYASELSPANFAETTAKGLWFIEHFSPYCVHCRKFKPTWEKLVAQAEKEIPEVKLATVDCVQHGDLCNQNGVDSYPSIFMFEDGKKLGEFKKARELDLLKEFMRSYVHTEKKATPPPPPLKHDEDDDDPLVPPPAAHHHDTHTAHTPDMAHRNHLNPSGQVLPLTSDTFAPTLSKGPTFIKFFAPWCGHCKKLAPTWQKLASRLQNKVTVAEVNCDDHGALCKEQGIQGYPTLVWFTGGDVDLMEGRSEYNGGRKLDTMEEFAEKAMNAGVHELESDSELEAFVAKEEVVYLLLHQRQESGVIPHIREVASPLLGSPPILSSSSPALLRQFSVPPQTPWALVAIKDHDTTLPSASFTATRSQSARDAGVKEWLMSHRLPTALELSQSTFQKVMNAPEKPLVVIAAVQLSDEGSKEHEKILERLKDVAKKWRLRTGGTGLASGREVVFSVMDKGRWGTWLKSMYGIQSKDRATEHHDSLDGVDVVIADHGELIYYNTDSAGQPISFSSTAKLFTTVEDAAAGKIAYKNSENFVERLARKLNNHMQCLEAYVYDHPYKFILFVLGFIVFFIWGLNKLLSSPSGGADEWRELKGKNGRLD